MRYDWRLLRSFQDHHQLKSITAGDKHDLNRGQHQGNYVFAGSTHLIVPLSSNPPAKLRQAAHNRITAHHDSLKDFQTALEKVDPSDELMLHSV